jgi:hypothetical protein
MTFRTVVLTVMCAALPEAAQAQKVQIIFTPAVLQQTVALKGALTADKIDSFGALSLVGAPSERKKDFGAAMSSYSVVIIVGEDALKATADIQFPVPVILVNAGGRTSALNRIIRVFDAAAPAAAVVVGPTDSVARVIAPVREIAIKGDVAPLVQALVITFKQSVATKQ